MKAVPKFLLPSVALLVALGFAAPTAAFAETTESLVPHRAHHMNAHQARAMSHRRRMEVEGLSRNPSDCVKYGCVGNN
ncbi:MAG: hypothetical protein JO136_11215 [Hyphomicrobiales bacterium]|nr:hypothetical protein [Hyphomicrobiales bacterium]MBV9910725.1 hypothetical protein [Hyphomicrobiales bacterium]